MLFRNNTKSRNPAPGTALNGFGRVYPYLLVVQSFIDHAKKIYHAYVRYFGGMLHDCGFKGE